MASPGWSPSSQFHPSSQPEAFIKKVPINSHLPYSSSPTSSSSPLPYFNPHNNVNGFPVAQRAAPPWNGDDNGDDFSSASSQLPDFLMKHLTGGAHARRPGPPTLSNARPAVGGKFTSDKNALRMRSINRTFVDEELRDISYLHDKQKISKPSQSSQPMQIPASNAPQKPQIPIQYNLNAIPNPASASSSLVAAIGTPNSNSVSALNTPPAPIFSKAMHLPPAAAPSKDLFSLTMTSMMLSQDTYEQKQQQSKFPSHNDEDEDEEEENDYEEYEDEQEIDGHDGDELDDKMSYYSSVTGTALAAALPPSSKLEEEFFVYNTNPVVRDASMESMDAKYNASSKQWQVKIFPSKNPSGRVEVLHLAKALDKMLLRHNSSKQRLSKYSIHAKKNKKIELLTRDLGKEADIWEVVLIELVRQVFIHCKERGVLLDKARVRLMEMLKSYTSMVKKCHHSIAKLREQVEFQKEMLSELEKTIGESAMSETRSQIASRQSTRFSARAAIVEDDDEEEEDESSEESESEQEEVQPAAPAPVLIRPPSPPSESEPESEEEEAEEQVPPPPAPPPVIEVTADDAEMTEEQKKQEMERKKQELAAANKAKYEKKMKDMKEADRLKREQAKAKASEAEKHEHEMERLKRQADEERVRNLEQLEAELAALEAVSDPDAMYKIDLLQRQKNSMQKELARTSTSFDLKLGRQQSSSILVAYSIKGAGFRDYGIQAEPPQHSSSSSSSAAALLEVDSMVGEQVTSESERSSDEGDGDSEDHDSEEEEEEVDDDEEEEEDGEGKKKKKQLKKKQKIKKLASASVSASASASSRPKHSSNISSSSSQPATSRSDKKTDKKKDVLKSQKSALLSPSSSLSISLSTPVTARSSTLPSSSASSSRASSPSKSRRSKFVTIETQTEVSALQPKHIPVVNGGPSSSSLSSAAGDLFQSKPKIHSDDDEDEHHHPHHHEHEPNTSDADEDDNAKDKDSLKEKKPKFKKMLLKRMKQNQQQVGGGGGGDVNNNNNYGLTGGGGVAGGVTRFLSSVQEVAKVKKKKSAPIPAHFKKMLASIPADYVSKPRRKKWINDLILEIHKKMSSDGIVIVEDAAVLAAAAAGAPPQQQQSGDLLHPHPPPSAAASDVPPPSSSSSSAPSAAADSKEYVARKASFAEVVYQFFLNKYGLKQLAETHLVDVLSNVGQMYESSTRMLMFARFCGISEWCDITTTITPTTTAAASPDNNSNKDGGDSNTAVPVPDYTKEDCNFFINRLMNISRAKFAKKEPEESEDGNLFIPLRTAKEILASVMEGVVLDQPLAMAQFQLRLDRLSRPCASIPGLVSSSTNKNKSSSTAPLVDFDELCRLIMDEVKPDYKLFQEGKLTLEQLLPPIAGSQQASALAEQIAAAAAAQRMAEETSKRRNEIASSPQFAQFKALMAMVYPKLKTLSSSPPGAGVVIMDDSLVVLYDVLTAMNSASDNNDPLPLTTSETMQLLRQLLFGKNEPLVSSSNSLPGPSVASAASARPASVSVPPVASVPSAVPSSKQAIVVTQPILPAGAVPVTPSPESAIVPKQQQQQQPPAPEDLWKKLDESWIEAEAFVKEKIAQLRSGTVAAVAGGGVSEEVMESIEDHHELLESLMTAPNRASQSAASAWAIFRLLLFEIHAVVAKVDVRSAYFLTLASRVQDKMHNMMSQQS